MVLNLDILVPLIPGLIAVIAGLVIHSFIIVINVTDWMRGRSVTPVDLIITSLGISRMCAQCATILHLYLHTFRVNNQANLDIIGEMYTFFTYANMWLTSLLSIVFCLKISNLSIRLFLYLRRMIDQRTVHFILASILLATFNVLLPLLTITEVTKGRTYNITMNNQSHFCHYSNAIYSHIISSFIPLLFCSLSSVLLITSLYHHITKMKMSGNLSINLETYYSAMTFVSITFMYNIIYFTSHFVVFIYYYLHCVDPAWPNIVLGFLPVLHSSFLIYRTTKLRSQVSKVVQDVIDFVFQRKDPGTREDIEMVA